MREIKFRAWGEFELKMWDITLHNSMNFLPETLNNVMQYTGIKDKNGKEIYEGDIVKVTDEDDKINSDYADTGIGIIEMLVDEGFWNISKIEEGLGDVTQSRYIEVIGNIYENPELLKGD